MTTARLKQEQIEQVFKGTSIKASIKRLKSSDIRVISNDDLQKLLKKTQEHEKNQTFNQTDKNLVDPVAKSQIDTPPTSEQSVIAPADKDLKKPESAAIQAGLKPKFKAKDAGQSQGQAESKNQSTSPLKPGSLKDLNQFNYQSLPQEVFAGFGLRISAYLVDWLIVQWLSRLILNLWSLSDRDSFTGIITILIYIGYFFLFTCFLRGRTPGKILFNLRVVPLDKDRQTLSWSSLLVREVFGRIIYYYAPWLGLILAVTPYHQHPVDMLTDTAVINENYLTAFSKMQTVH